VKQIIVILANGSEENSVALYI